MTDFDAYKKINETKAMNNRHGRISGSIGQSFRRHARDLSRWRIEQSSTNTGDNPPLIGRNDFHADKLLELLTLAHVAPSILTRQKKATPCRRRSTRNVFT